MLSTGWRCLTGLRILLVDDDAHFRESFTTLLTIYGAMVTTSHGAADARARLEEERFDLLLSDIAMPGEDGCELIARLRQSPDRALRTIRAAAMSADREAFVRRRALDAGFDLFVCKQNSVASIVAALDTLADHERRRPDQQP